MTDIDLPSRLADALARPWSRELRDLLYGPVGTDVGLTWPDVIELVEVGATELPAGLLPLAGVDEASIAVVVLGEGDTHPPGTVLRWFLTDVDPVKQLAILDTDPLMYLESVDQELRSRKEGVDRVLDEIGPAYQDSYIAKEKRPRDFVVRPVRIACQNVIVALAAIAQDSSFDGLSVLAWQTCEVPHVATHEPNRALAALTLCDAFQNGGTMEIRFDREASVIVDGKRITYHAHPENAVPASLRRYGRSVGVTLGAEDPAAISPAEARALFLAITPMPGDLRARVDTAVAHHGIAPERICFTLLSQVWREIELDFILATSARAGSILAGGADWQHRGARQAEAEICRAAVMLGMLFRRLNSSDAAATDSELRVVEDRVRGVSWAIDDATGVVTFGGLKTDERVPWTHGVASSSIRVMSTSRGTDELVAALRPSPSSPVGVVVPRDVHPTGLPDGVMVLRCPDRLADLDKSVEANLLKSRISRG